MARLVGNAISLGVGVTFILCNFCVMESGSISVWKDVTLTQDEKYALDKFKVIMNNSLPHDHMRKDIYLIKWLRAQNLDVRGAERMLKQHLVWRKENSMDTIVDEDFDQLVYEYPYSTDGTDFEDRPVLAMGASDWDIRRAILSGKKDELIRWAFRAYEIGARRVRSLQEANQNVTQFVMVCNFDEFNLIQHACLQCVDVLVNFLAVYEQNFPGMADSIIGIKTPQSFELVLRALARVMSKETQEAIKIWGPNKNEWKTNILKQIPADQLDEDFGGTRNAFKY